MYSERSGSEVTPARQPRKPLTGGFLPGLNHRRQSSSSQRLSHLLDSKPHIHFSRASLPVSRHRKQAECLYFNDEDEGRDVGDQDENHQVRQSSFRHHKRTNSPSTSTETSRVGLLRRRPSSTNLRASASLGTSNPAVIVESVALKVRQFSATARSTSGLCCIGYSNLLPIPPESSVPNQCISADGTTSTRGKHARRRSSTSSSPSTLSKRTTSSSETLKPLRVHSTHLGTASGEEVHRNGNNSTGATASGLSSDLVASATVSASPKPRSTRPKAPNSSSRKSREKGKDREKSKAKPLEDNVSLGTGPPTSSNTSRTRTSPSSHTSKRLLPPVAESSSSSCDSPFSTPSRAFLNVGHAELSPGNLTQTTGSGSTRSSSIPLHSSASASAFPSHDIFSTSLDFVFPAFDELDDLIRWDMDSLPVFPSPSDSPGPEIKRNDSPRLSHQNRSDAASRSPSSSNIDPQYTTSVSTRGSTSASVSPLPESNSLQSPSSSTLTSFFSTPFDDEPLESQNPFPSTRRVLMEDTRVKKSKTLAFDKARTLSGGSNLSGLTSTLMQRNRYVSPTISSPPSGGPVSSLAFPTSSPFETSGPVDLTPPSTPPLAPLPAVPAFPTSESTGQAPTPSPNNDNLNIHPPVMPHETRHSLPSGLPAPFLPFSSTAVPSPHTSYVTSPTSARNPAQSSSPSARADPTQPPGDAVNIVGSTGWSNPRSSSAPVTQAPRHPPLAPLHGLLSAYSPISASTQSLSPTSTSPSTSSASDSGYGSNSANKPSSGRRRSSPRTSDQEKSKRKSSGSDDPGGSERKDGKGWGGTTKTWTDTSGCVHLGAEDCTLEVIFPQAKDFEVWDMSDSSWVAVPVFLYLMAKDAKRWIGVPLAMPDVTHIDLHCQDSPVPVAFEWLTTGTTLSASSSAFYGNSYSTSFLGGKSALDDVSPFGTGKGHRSGSGQRPSGKGRGMSMMEALRKKEEEQSMNSDRISIEGKWVRTYNRPGVEGAKSMNSDDFRSAADQGASVVGGASLHTPSSSSLSRRSSPTEGSKDIKNVHRGWYLKFWIPIPTRLFVKRETRVFTIRAQAWLMGDEEEEEKGLRRGNTVLDRFEIGMDEVEKWLGGAENEEEQEDAQPLIAETEMSVSHLRREREMDR